MGWNVPLIPLDQLAWLCASPSLLPVGSWGTEGLAAGCCGETQLCPNQTQYKFGLGEILKELVYNGVLFLQEGITRLENCIQKAVSEWLPVTASRELQRLNFDWLQSMFLCTWRKAVLFFRIRVRLFMSTVTFNSQNYLSWISLPNNF